MRIRLVVADQSEARFYELRSPDAVELVGRVADPVAHLHERDLVSDRPGANSTMHRSPRDGGAQPGITRPAVSTPRASMRPSPLPGVSQPSSSLADDVATSKGLS